MVNIQYVDHMFFTECLQLSGDTLLHVFEYLDARSLAIASAVCRYFLNTTCYTLCSSHFLRKILTLFRSSLELAFLVRGQELLTRSFELEELTMLCMMFSIAGHGTWQQLMISYGVLSSCLSLVPQISV